MVRHRKITRKQPGNVSGPETGYGYMCDLCCMGIIISSQCFWKMYSQVSLSNSNSSVDFPFSIV